MNCEDNFCIYCENSRCILENIGINNLAMCDSCIVVNLVDDILNAEKRKILDKYDEQYRGWDKNSLKL